MKRLGGLLLAVLLLLVLAGCGGYVSHYKAVALVRSNTSDKAEMSFSSFAGKMVFQLRCREPACLLKYSAELESGTAAVYCELDGIRTELAAVGAGDAVAAFTELTGKGMAYIIVETRETCREGRFRFEIEQPKGE